jgi:hypothetical protein
MSDGWQAAAFGALGTIIGAAASSGALIIQGRRQTIAEMKKTAVQLALEDFRFRIQDHSGQVQASSAAALIFYYDKLVELTANGQLNKTTLRKLLNDQWILQKAADEESQRLRAAER